jgi:hypothetical protein
LPRKKGGKVANWEGSKKDEAQDRMLAKKYGISMEAWEKSAKDKKHDKQQSMEGLKKGGRAHKEKGGSLAEKAQNYLGPQTEAQRMGAARSKSKAFDETYAESKNPSDKFKDARLKASAEDKMASQQAGYQYNPKTESMDYEGNVRQYKKGGRTAKYSGGGVFSGSSYPGKVPGAVGGRHAHAKGGKAKGKGKTNINIVIAAGHKPEGMDMGMPNAPVPAPKAMPVPPPMPSAAMPAGGGMPPMPPPGAMPPQGGMPMPRKAGGRTIHVIDHGAGGGKGRKEKIKAYGANAGKVVGKVQ